MNNDWTKGLDRYLTSGPPDDGYERWCEEVSEHIPEETFEEMESEDFWDSERMDKWMEWTFDRKKEIDYDGEGNPKQYGYLEPLMAANIITKAWKIFKKKLL